MSWKPVFKMPNDPNWYDNAQRFATKEEAEASARARFMVWTMPSEYGVQESDDPVNYRRDPEKGDIMINRDDPWEPRKEESTETPFNEGATS